MFNSSGTDKNETMDGSSYNSLSSNDNDISRFDINDQRYSDQNQQVISNIMEDESDEENDEEDALVAMDITETIDPVRISQSHSLQMSSPSHFQSFGDPRTLLSSNTTYQPKCARPAASSVERYRQWQILGGGFGENYDILPPEEEELDEESKKEADEEEEFENDLNSFLEQIISVHVRRQLNKDQDGGANNSVLSCTCLRSDCRVKQFVTRRTAGPSCPSVQEINPTRPSSTSSFRTSGLSANSITSNNLSDVSSNSASSAANNTNRMLNLVLKQKNSTLNLSPESTSEPESRVHTKIKSPRHHHHTIQNVSTPSSQVISQQQKQYQTVMSNPNMTSIHLKAGSEYESSYPMPELPKECSTELRKAHEDIIRRAGGISRVKRVYDELAFLSPCFGGLRPFLESSPKDGNTLLMWLCCQPHKPRPTMARKIHGVALDINRHLYSKIIAVAMAMIWEAYGSNDTKDVKDKCLLFERNSQEASSLELAALTNKAMVACWLALLHPCFGRDVNETNQLGHTVLHFLARKGDEASDTLQELLKLRNPSSISSSSSFFGTRMFRLDVVNGGAKTPLDVAVACELNNRKDGSSDTQYKKVISYFHDSIVEEAEEFEKRINS